MKETRGPTRPRPRPDPDPKPDPDPSSPRFTDIRPNKI